MFKLLRRISYGVIPRPDRPWEDDPTSNAPQTGKKRRLSSTEREVEGDDDKVNIKKARGESATPSVADAEGTFAVPALPVVETEEVKEVTQGVEEVALEEKDGQNNTSAAPESIPLPDERSGELDELASDASSSPAAEPSIDSIPVQTTVEDVPGQEDGESSVPVVEELIETPKSLEKDTSLPEKGTVKKTKKIFESSNTEQTSDDAPTEE